MTPCCFYIFPAEFQLPQVVYYYISPCFATVSLLSHEFNAQYTKTLAQEVRSTGNGLAQNVLEDRFCDERAPYGEWETTLQQKMYESKAV